MKFKIASVGVLLLLAACSTSEPVESPRSTTPAVMPGGYAQFCSDFPKSLLCDQFKQDAE